MRSRLARVSLLWLALFLAASVACGQTTDPSTQVHQLFAKWDRKDSAGCVVLVRQENNPRSPAHRASRLPGPSRLAQRECSRIRLACRHLSPASPLRRSVRERVQRACSRIRLACQERNLRSPAHRAYRLHGPEYNHLQDRVSNFRGLGCSLLWAGRQSRHRLE